MKKLYIFENHLALDLSPLTLNRPAFDLRCGAFTMLDRVQRMKHTHDVSLIVRREIEGVTRENYPDLNVNPDAVDDGIWLLGNVLWTEEDLFEIETSVNTLFYDRDKTLIAANLAAESGNKWLAAGGPISGGTPEAGTVKELQVKELRFLWDFIHAIPDVMQHDTAYFQHHSITDRQHWVHPEQIYITSPEHVSPGAVIDASGGPVIIDKDAKISAFSYLKGPLYVGKNTEVHPHSHIKESVLGPQSRVAGELSNVIILGYSNKAHDGFLGNAYLGEWVNLGAGTTNSNLKNNYESVVVRVNDQNVDTNSLFIGSFIGDHTKTAIGTLLNTGTVIGLGCNIVSSGFPRRDIPSFHWCINGKMKKTSLDQFLKTAAAVKQRRGKNLSNAEKQLLTAIQEKL